MFDGRCVNCLAVYQILSMTLYRYRKTRSFLQNLLLATTNTISIFGGFWLCPAIFLDQWSFFSAHLCHFLALPPTALSCLQGWCSPHHDQVIQVGGTVFLSLKRWVGFIYRRVQRNTGQFSSAIIQFVICPITFSF